MTMMMTLADAQAMLPGSTLVGEPSTPISRVHSDTRSLQPGDLFVALKGEHFDAHAFLGQAANSGAVAALAERGLAEATLPGLLVPDTLAALQQLAAAWRQRFVLPLIAVTGSNGKTTVTQMIASILRAWVPEHAFYTQGNFNNHIGVPLTLLRLRQDETTWHKAGVIELGMNHVGEIALLAAIARPTVALVNNAQREHQEFMASVEAVARENGSVINALPASGVAVYPADDVQAPVWHALAGDRPHMTFAMQGDADVTGSAAWVDGVWSLTLITPAGKLVARLNVPGRHNLKNAMAAATCALAAGAPLDAIAKGLEAFEPVKGRSQSKSFMHSGKRISLIDDTYNANPDSVRAAIDVLAELPGPQWLVLGDMGEVGEQGPQFHAEVGDYARERGIPALWTAGAQCAVLAAAYGASARHFASVPDLIDALGQAPLAGSVLVKGSRFMQMERVVQALVESSKGGA